MKKLIFICGPNGVGKSTTSQRLNECLIIPHESIAIGAGV